MFLSGFGVALLIASLFQANSPDSLNGIAGEREQQEAARINNFAEQIHSEADAREFVDAVAKTLSDTMPRIWTGTEIRARVARAEFAAVSDSSRLISEQRIADVWNEYVGEIGAPDDLLVTAGEIHNLRDANHAGAQYWWEMDNRSIWTMPAIYALGENGKVAFGCRALDAIMVLHDLDNTFSNLRAARERMKKEIVASDLLKTHAQARQVTGVLVARTEADINPIRSVERTYIQTHGQRAYNKLLQRLFDELFP